MLGRNRQKSSKDKTSHSVTQVRSVSPLDQLCRQRELDVFYGRDKQCLPFELWGREESRVLYWAAERTDFSSTNMWVEWACVEGSEVLFAHVSLRCLLAIQGGIARMQWKIMRLELEGEVGTEDVTLGGGVWSHEAEWDHLGRGYRQKREVVQGMALWDQPCPKCCFCCRKAISSCWKNCAHFALCQIADSYHRCEDKWSNTVSWKSELKGDQLSPVKIPPLPDPSSVGIWTSNLEASISILVQIWQAPMAFSSGVLFSRSSPGHSPLPEECRSFCLWPSKASFHTELETEGWRKGPSKAAGAWIGDVLPILPINWNSFHNVFHSPYNESSNEQGLC